MDLVDDAHGERSVLLHAQVARERREADQPEGEQVAAVEGEVEEAGEVDEEVVGEVLGLVEDDHGRGAALVDHVHEGLLDVGPQLGAAVGGLHADLGGEGAVEVERRHRGVAEVEHEVVGPGQLRAEVADGGGLADAGLGGEDTQAGIVDELPEGAVELLVAGALSKKVLPWASFGSGWPVRPKRWRYMLSPPCVLGRLASVKPGGGRGADGPDALVVLVLDEGERIEAARLASGAGSPRDGGAGARRCADGRGVRCRRRSGPRRRREGGPSSRGSKRSSTSGRRARGGPRGSRRGSARCRPCARSGARGGGRPRRGSCAAAGCEGTATSASQCSRGARPVVSCLRAWYSAASQAQCLALSSARGSGSSGSSSPTSSRQVRCQRSMTPLASQSSTAVCRRRMPSSAQMSTSEPAM